jgi:hypothetical protein
MRPSRRWVVVAGLAAVVVGAGLWLWRVASAPAEVAAGDDVSAGRRTARSVGPPPAAGSARPAPPAEPAPGTVETFRGRDTYDPCRPARATSVPRDYSTTTYAGVTVAWDPHGVDHFGERARVSPTEIAALAGGTLEAAAQLTGTSARPALTIIVDSSKEEFLRRTGADNWMGGFYDGAQIRTYAARWADLGVSIATLRHEVMHAQLHAAVGCMPAWFDEGMAQYFAQEVSTKTLTAMFRDRRMLEPGSIATIDDYEAFGGDSVALVYASSLAMIAYLAPADDEPLRAAVRWLVRAQRSGAPRELWTTVAPGIGGREVLAALANRIWGRSPGELDLGGGVCCWGADLRDLRCARSPSPPANTDAPWIEHVDGHVATCEK